MEKLIFDSCFLIDYEREIKKQTQGPAQAFLAKLGKTKLFMSVVAFGEISIGFDSLEEDFAQAILREFEIIPVTANVGWRYSIIYKELKKKNNLIGSNDLWIAAHALELKAGVVTRNKQDFSRIQGLKIVTY